MGRLLPDDPLQTVAPLPRSVFAFLAVALGMILARHGPPLPGAFFFALAAGAAAVSTPARGRACAAALFVAALCLGAGVFTSRIHLRPADALAAFFDGAPAEGGEDGGFDDGGAQAEDGLLVTVEGLALDDPRAPVIGGALARFGQVRPSGVFTLDVSSVLTDQGWRQSSGRLRVRVPGSRWSPAGGLAGFPVAAGQRVRITGRARAVPPPLNPGEPDLRLYAAQEGLAGTLEAGDAALVRVLAGRPEVIPSLRAWFCRARGAVRERARAVLDPGPGADDRARALVLSLFLGAQEPGERELRLAFTGVGLAHVLAISGFHLTVMAYVALFLVRLTGDRGFLEPAIVAALVLLYLVAVPASAPVVRAGLLTLALMAAEARGRRYEALAVLGWAGVALVLWRPLDLWSLGFQLSLGLTALLLWIGRYFRSRLFAPPILGLIRRARPLHVGAPLFVLEQIKSALACSLLCWGAAMPLIAWRTGLVSPLAVLTTLLVLPPILALMAAGYVVLVAGIVFPQGAGAAGAALEWLASINVGLVDALDRLPGSSVRIPPIGSLWAAAATAVVLYWALHGHARSVRAWCAAAVIGAWLGADVVLAQRRQERTALRLDALAVGDGSCAILRSAGQTVMWNCGSSRAGAGERLIPDAARALGAWRVPVVVLAGPGPAHLGAVLDIVEPLGVRRVILAPAVASDAQHRPEGAAAWTIRELRRTGVEIVEAADKEAVRFGQAALTIGGDGDSALDAGAGPDGAPAFGAVTLAGWQGTAVRLGIQAGSAAGPGPIHPIATVAERAMADIRASPARGAGQRIGFVNCSARTARPAASAALPGAPYFLTGTDGAFFAEFEGGGRVRAGAFRRTQD